MDDAAGVGEVDRPGEQLDEMGGRPQRLRRPADLALQRVPVDQLQGEERPAGVLADLVDLDDVRVREPGDDLGLGPEPVVVAVVGVAAGPDHLQRDEPVQGGLAGLVDDAHAAAADLADDLVARDADPARGGRRRGERRRAGPQLRQRRVEDLRPGRAGVGADEGVVEPGRARGAGRLGRPRGGGAGEGLGHHIR